MGKSEIDVNTNTPSGKKKVLTWIFFLIYIITLYLIERPGVSGPSSYQTGNQIGQIIGGAFVYFAIGYIFFWLFTFKIKDTSSHKFLILGGLGFIIGLFIMTRLTH